MKRHIVKKTVILSMAAILAIASFAGCGKKKDEGKNASARKVVEYDVNDYVTLGAYEGLSVEEKITQVTDADVQEKADALVKDNTTYSPVTDRNVQSGDKITINYDASVDGAQTDNQSNYELTVGEATLGEDFDAHMLNLAVGGNIQFTTQTDSTDNATGETKTISTTYNVTLVSISQPVVPEFNDEFVAAHSDYKTVAEYMAGIRTEQETQNAESAKTTAQNDLLNQVVESSTVSGTPAYIYNLNYNSINQQYDRYESYGLSRDSMGVTDESIKLQTVDMVKQMLIIEAVCKAAGIDITDEQYEEKLKEYEEQYGSSVRDNSREELLADMRREAVLNYLYEHNNVSKVTVSSDNQ